MFDGRIPAKHADQAPRVERLPDGSDVWTFNGTVIPFAWFAKGLRILDVKDPYAPREVGFYEPDPPEGFPLASSNDVTIDRRGLIYLIDRQRGVDIVATSVW